MVLLDLLAQYEPKLNLAGLWAHFRCPCTSPKDSAVSPTRRPHDNITAIVVAIEP